MRPALIGIARLVLPHFGMGDECLFDLEGKDRHRSIAEARKVLFWVARKRLTYMSYPELGRDVGNRDHTTVMSAVKKIDRLVQSDSTHPLAVVAVSVMLELEARDRPSGVVSAPALPLIDLGATGT